jgi:hypothetical protein
LLLDCGVAAWTDLRSQALATGQSPRAIARRLGSGRWAVAMPAVYAIASTHDSWGRRALAVQLWAGVDAALSHLTAAALLGLRIRRSVRIDITTPRRIEARGVLVHRSALDPGDMQQLGPFTVTGTFRTLVDLAGVVDEGPLEECLEDALFRRLTDVPTVLRRVQNGMRGAKGAAVLRRIVEMGTCCGTPRRTISRRCFFAR